VNGGGIGEQKCRDGDGSGNSACIYLLMEQGLTSVSAWSQRTKRRQFHFSHTRLIVALAKTKKARVHYNRLFFLLLRKFQ
jgi:predicted cupin superfamily sugar epimerase